MKKIERKDLFFIIYMLVVVVLGFVYFSVPERADFFEFQVRWWNEMFGVIRASF